jgi:hypothetical protein
MEAARGRACTSPWPLSAKVFQELLRIDLEAVAEAKRGLCRHCQGAAGSGGLSAQGSGRGGGARGAICLAIQLVLFAAGMPQATDSPVGPVSGAPGLRGGLPFRRCTTRAIMASCRKTTISRETSAHVRTGRSQ